MTSQDKMAALNTRVEDLDKDIAELQHRRESLAVDYAAGNKSAQKECAQIELAESAAKRERDYLKLSISQLTQLAQDEQAAVLEAVEEQRQLKAADLAESLCDVNSAIDSKLAELKSLLQLRADNLNSLRGLNVIDPMYVSRMGRSTVTAAFAAAGLHKFIAMDVPAPTSIRPMSDGNCFLSGIGKSKVETAA
jgi:hypothetical protein